MNEMRGKRERKMKYLARNALGSTRRPLVIFYSLNLFVESTYFCTAKVRDIFLQSYSLESRLNPKRKISSFFALERFLNFGNISLNLLCKISY